MLMNQPIYHRMAEISAKWETETPNASEMNELRESLKKHSKIMEDVIKLNNLSMAAHIANDTEWQHRICAVTEEFATTGVFPKDWLTYGGEK